MKFKRAWHSFVKLKERSYERGRNWCKPFQIGERGEGVAFGKRKALSDVAATAQAHHSMVNEPDQIN